MEEYQLRDPADDDDSGVRSQSEGAQGLLQVTAALWRRKSLLLLGGTVGLVLGAIHYSRQAPVYQSSAEVMVIKKQLEANLPDSNNSASMTYVGNYVSAHSRLLKSPLLIERARETGAIPPGSSAGGLSVDMDGNVLLLSISGGNPDTCQQILEGVISTYEDFLDETYKNVNEETLKQITLKAGTLQAEIKLLGKEHQEFLENRPMLWKSSDGSTLYGARLAAIEERRSHLAIEKAEIDSRLMALHAAIRNGEDQETLLVMIADFSVTTLREPESVAMQRNSAADLERELMPLAMQEQLLLEDYGSRHPDVVAVRKQIEMTREFHRNVEQLHSDIILAAAGHDETGSTDLVQEHLEHLERKLKWMEASDQALAELAQQEQERVKQLTDYEFREKQLTGDLERAERFYETLITQLQGVNLTKDLGGYLTSVLTPPGRGYRIGPDPVRSIAPMVVMGLLGGLGLVYLAEVTDRRFRTPEEIRHRLNLPVVGHIPFLESDSSAVAGDSALDPTLCVFHNPRSVEAEAYRAIRTALYFSAQGEKHRIIQVTSPSAGDGKSTQVANLAISIAKAGHRTVLVDADLRKPRQSKIFGVSNEVGLASVIAGRTELADAVQDSGVEGLQILPSGPAPSDPSELLTSPRFAELLELLRGKYDYILVDTPPLLIVTDPSVVAPRVDGVLLTIRITKSGSQQAVRAKAILQGVKANVLGVIVNDRERAASGYGYGRYGYGYGGYGYGYGRKRYGYGGAYHDPYEQVENSEGESSRQGENAKVVNESDTTAV